MLWEVNGGIRGHEDDAHIGGFLLILFDFLSFSLFLLNMRCRYFLTREISRNMGWKET